MKTTREDKKGDGARNDDARIANSEEILGVHAAARKMGKTMQKKYAKCQQSPGERGHDGAGEAAPRSELYEDPENE